MRRTIGIEIRTYGGPGGYRHEVFDIGINARNRSEMALPNEVVEALKRANERAYDAMPEGSSELISIIKYSRPSKR